MSSFRSAAICITREEQRDVFEWVSYHKALGFDRIFLYDHLSNDRTGEIATHAGAEVIRWEEVESPQGKAYNHALKTIGADFDWMAFLDIDEFFVPMADGAIPAFLDRIEPHTAVAVNWRCYGSSGHEKHPEGLIVDSFLQRAPDDYSANRHVKSFIRPQYALRCRNPHRFDLSEGDYVTPTGDPIDWVKPGKSAVVPDDGIARVNHYHTRSRAHYLKKLSLPRATKGVREDHFHLVDRNDVYDPILPEMFSGLLEPIRKRNERSHAEP
jgi:glycosyltransferase involved in cell wall biosynthesis